MNQPKAIIKRKFIGIPLAIIISLFILPLIIGMEQSYGESLISYGAFALPFILLFGVPVHIISTFLALKVPRYKTLLNFVIHIGSAYLVAFLLFKSEWYFISVCTASIAAIFFAVDEVLFRPNNSRIKKVLLSLVPIAVWAAVYSPIMIGSIQAKHTLAEINKEGKPIPEITVNGETKSFLKATYCWDSDNSSGCPENDHPFLLGKHDSEKYIFDAPGKSNISIHLKGTKQDYSLVIYYIEGNETKKLTTKKHQFSLPADVPDQYVKAMVITENSRKISLWFGIRH
ncbi:hypothetical protein [Falsibacillus albus]|uniref:Uncharacterized protein n=1 Tax=Falsibacillus albus TaxID=2478915 RepID=A0A3L7JW63_9BACI|nr:hypothetical protein [Falsibacillus albus]RLQ94555.1 hypothetical protein D9X91_13525 [Falsibacillus albus]